jgi:uncharacterized protein
MRLLMLLVLLFPHLSFGSEENKRFFEEQQVLADQGDAFAQFNLGVMYDYGQVFPKDDKEAVKWYRLAAEQGHTSAQYFLGVMYDVGSGVPEDDKEAVKWYRKAAEQGHAKAQYFLGGMYNEGEGVPEDNLLAYMWVNLAGANGYDVSKAKEMLASRMTQADISKAQELTRQYYFKGNPGVF